MPIIFSKTTVATLCLIALGSMALADDTIDDIDAFFEEAMPNMHHSCESILDTYPDDDDQVAKIVRQMAIVSLYNRQLDILAIVPEDDRSGLVDEFIEELEDACDDDPGRLLAGAVDDAVKETMAPFD